MTKPDTKTRILEAAQTEFSAKGYEGASIRGIADRAGVQLAAVRYHLGSKDELFKAVFERHAEAVADRRARILADLEAAGRGDQIEDVIETIIGPVLAFRFDSKEGRAFAKLMANTVSNPDDRSRALTKSIFDPAAEALVDRIRAAVPGLSRRDAYWSFFLSVGAMAMACSNGERLSRISDGLCNPDDPDETLEALVTFAAGGAMALARKGQPK
ncbi:MAG: TetR/AcrR family transcriptional regulator [Alphaproteobacteria bacterium]